jgi:hypothetical protein
LSGGSSIQEELPSGVLWQLVVTTPDFMAVGLPLRRCSALPLASPARRRQVVCPRLLVAGWWRSSIVKLEEGEDGGLDRVSVLPPGSSVLIFKPLFVIFFFWVLCNLQ